MDGTIIKNQPLLSLVLFTLTLLLGELIHLFSDSGEELPDEIEVFILSVSAFDYSPVCESVFGNDGDEGETFSFVDGAVDSDLFIWSGPSLVSGHV